MKEVVELQEKIAKREKAKTTLEENLTNFQYEPEEELIIPMSMRPFLNKKIDFNLFL